jgi:succinyl-CoA synthetase beta subunit
MKPEQILKKATDEARTALSEYEGKLLAASLGIPCPPGHLVRDSEQAVERAEELGYPVVAKLCSPRILHKTEIGAVLLSLKTDEQVTEAVDHLLTLLETKDDEGSVLIEKMVSPGIESIVGLVTDPHLGPVVMAGLGGIYTELFQDVSFRLAPIEKAEAKRLVESLNGSQILHGYRGQAEVDLSALLKVIVTVSKIPLRLPQISQLDLNPLILHQHGLVAVDVKVVLK